MDLPVIRRSMPVTPVCVCGTRRALHALAGTVFPPFPFIAGPEHFFKIFFLRGNRLLEGIPTCVLSWRVFLFVVVGCFFAGVG